jgi:hypothetical protein
VEYVLGIEMAPPLGYLRLAAVCPVHGGFEGRDEAELLHQGQAVLHRPRLGDPALVYTIEPERAPAQPLAARTDPPWRDCPSRRRSQEGDGSGEAVFVRALPTICATWLMRE